jgi:PleD family two-component response regulator
MGREGPKIDATAALGLVEWHASESIKEVLARADALMYKQKAEMHKQSGAAPGTRVN